MNRKKTWLIPIAALALLIIILAVVFIVEHLPASDTPDQTEREETFVASSDGAVTCEDGILFEAYPAETPVGEWLAGCSAPDRDEQFEAYVLRHTVTEGDQTTFTYLIYYRHHASAMKATPALYAGEGGNYRLDVTYTPGTGTEDYTLTRLVVVLPTADSPRLKLIAEDEAVGKLTTVSQVPIPSGANG